MKLLFDQNLSHKLGRLLLPVFSGSSHIRHVGLDGASDRAIWSFAGANGYALVSFDEDFADLARRHGPPPKVVWLRCRNQPSSVIADLLNGRAVELLLFESDDTSLFEIA